MRLGGFDVNNKEAVRARGTKSMEEFMQIAFEGFSIGQMLSGDTFSSGCCTFLPGYLNFLKSKAGPSEGLENGGSLLWVTK